LTTRRSTGARVRLGTLNNLRWLAVVGQAVALLVVRLGLDFDFPVVLAATPIVASALLNVMLAVAYPSARRVSPREATAFLGYDIVQLAVLLFFTGGIENPFSLLFIAPVVIAASTLDLTSTLFLGGLAAASISFLAETHLPLPWSPVNGLRLPQLYQIGIWVSLILGIGFTSIYAWRIASEASRMSDALSATQLALAREHRLASLGALAAAAAHELGTPRMSVFCVRRPNVAARYSRASRSRRRRC
jgi:two-component system sensor histidine kinase RegB